VLLMIDCSRSLDSEIENSWFLNLPHYGANYYFHRS
jgi:hypothetical protein